MPYRLIKIKYFCSLFVLALAISAYLVLLSSIFANARARSLAVSNQAATAEQVADAIKTVHDLQLHKRELAQLQAYFVNDSDTPHLMNELDTLAQTTHVRMRVNSLSATQAPPALEISLSAEGGFQALAQFAQALENLPLKIVLRDVAFVHGTGNPVSGALAAPPDSIQAPWSLTLTFAIKSYHGS